MIRNDKKDIIYKIIRAMVGDTPHDSLRSSAGHVARE